ncbi:N6 adenine specific DNA methylase [Tubulinosema ratisbonensis]|uniref:N6 adenine specific DNA methylase n=1 Tax=Tubulinosema ratisbonensis TaxID=291195 RepID=A0A437APT1_9MICR|nr:N6 adenine specific DNA methylase [Tubulinosema ratisbonensis]
MSMSRRHFFIHRSVRKGKDFLKNKIILEVGCGSGEISTCIYQKNSIYLTSDINIKAVKHTQARGNFLAFHSDLLQNVNQDYLDVIIFNPPYLPSVEELNDTIDLSYKGGKSGIDVIYRFIDSVTVKCFYLLVIQKNDPIKIINLIESKGYKVDILGNRRVLGEFIVVIKCNK